MKCRLAILLSSLLLIGNLCACGENNVANENRSVVIGTESHENKKTEESIVIPEKEEEIIPDDLGYVYTEDCFGYSINVLGNYNEALGYGFASYEGDMARSEVIYITQYSGEVGDEEQLERIDMSQYGDSTDIFDLLIGNIDAELFGGSYYILLNTDVEVIETKEINGVEMTKFEGTMTAYHEYVQQECVYPIVAYGIKSSKTPILVSCIDRTEDSSSHEIWVDKIDDVVSTFKDGE